MSDHISSGRLSGTSGLFVNVSKELKHEVLRKLLHLLIATTPALCSILGTSPTIMVLGLGILAYSIAEYLRMSGFRVPLISRITEMAMRERDKSHFVLGPVTLGLGAMFALLFYPNPAASIAIYALAFGDGFASLAGKLFGSVKIPLTGGKTLEGSIVCFAAVFFATLLLVPQVQVRDAALIAATATAIELIPARDFDNLLLPAGTGLVAMLLI